MNTIINLAEAIEDILEQNDLHPFGGLQRRRAHCLNYKHRDHKIFNKSPSLKRDGYTFHWGGLDELQFNIGIQTLGIRNVLRYGVAFSLKATQSIPNPTDKLGKLIKRFNKFINDYPTIFEDLTYWINEKDKFGATVFEKVVPIEDKFIREGNFIFIGNYFEQDDYNLNDDQLLEIVSTFDKLIPVYEGVVLNNYFEPKDTRIIRLTWNTNGWELPSGREGKSKNKDTHEGKYGFGFEEWLFDKSKMLDGYLYGFMQPFHSNGKSTFSLTKRDVKLYTFDGINKQRYWVGAINDIEIVGKEISRYAYERFDTEGWLDQRKKDLIPHDLDPNTFVKNNQFIDDPTSLFNVRFRPDQIESLHDELVPMKEEEYQAINSDRYKAIRDRLSSVKNEKSYAIKGGNKKYSPKDFKPKITRSTRTEKKEFKNVHDQIQVSFSNWLYNRLNPNILEVEHPTEDGRKLDIYMVHGGKQIIFEVKSYNSLKTSLNVGLGQLIDYNFFPDNEQVDELYLVSNIHPDREIKKYIEHINERLSLKFGYINFDLIRKNIIEQVGIKLI
ncbi:hypothetical protein [Fodinibius sediminis]|uniref:Uncharacterized protein n=1 Tax=Fodinibius sediminis TaxID=1214077 RepID=A0A521DLJ7_9BACT|nr:hypothetical protein [Fodinibius sediminis]SMO72498.1 hypothetical protein SAMN06265218_11114 [Fodinibius sediminis]